MKYLAAYLLLQLGGNSSPSASDIKSLLDVVGIEAEEDRLDKVIAEVGGKDVNEVGVLYARGPGLGCGRRYGRGGEGCEGPARRLSSLRLLRGFAPSIPFVSPIPFSYTITSHFSSRSSHVIR